jgi:hypothetical protein
LEIIILDVLEIIISVFLYLRGRENNWIKILESKLEKYVAEEIKIIAMESAAAKK